MLDLDDVRWELGRFGKLNVRHGKGARRTGPRVAGGVARGRPAQQAAVVLDNLWLLRSGPPTPSRVVGGSRAASWGSPRTTSLPCCSSRAGISWRGAFVALRSLFGFAKRRRLIFADPTRRLHVGRAPTRAVLPMTDTQIAAVEHVAVTPARRLVVALVAVHAARAAAIRELTLDDVDLAGRRITLGGHSQRLSEFVHQALVTWLQHRQRTWPHTPNRHVLVSVITATGTGPVSDYYLTWHLLLRGVQLEHIRGDRVLHEALAVGADPLRLVAVFHLCPDDRDRLRRHRPQPPRMPHRVHPGAGRGVRAVPARPLNPALVAGPGHPCCSATWQSGRTGRDHDRQQPKAVGFVLTVVHSG